MDTAVQTVHREIALRAGGLCIRNTDITTSKQCGNIPDAFFVEASVNVVLGTNVIHHFPPVFLDKHKFGFVNVVTDESLGATAQWRSRGGYRDAYKKPAFLETFRSCRAVVRRHGGEIVLCDISSISGGKFFIGRALDLDAIQHVLYNDKPRTSYLVYG